MKATTKQTMKNAMCLAWQFVKNNGKTMSDALKCAWRNIKLNAELPKRIVRFTFEKVNGEIRQAYGTLKATIVPPTQGNRRDNPSLKTYFDTEKKNGAASRWLTSCLSAKKTVPRIFTAGDTNTP